MTNKKITDFTRLESITGNEYLPIAQEFNNWKIDINQIKTFLGAGLEEWRNEAESAAADAVAARNEAVPAAATAIAQASAATSQAVISTTKAGESAGSAAAASNSAATAASVVANAQPVSRTLALWTDLAALTPVVAGEGAEVLDSDAGTHADPSTSATVANAGKFKAYALTAGAWTRIGGTGLSAKADKVAALITSADIFSSIGTRCQAFNGATTISVGSKLVGFTIPSGSTGRTSYVTADVPAAALRSKVIKLVQRYAATAAFPLTSASIASSFATYTVAGTVTALAVTDFSRAQTGTEIVQTGTVTVPANADFVSLITAIVSTAPAVGADTSLQINGVSYQILSDRTAVQTDNDVMLDKRLEPVKQSVIDTKAYADTAMLTSGDVWGTATGAKGAGQGLNGGVLTTASGVPNGISIPANSGNGGSSYITSFMGASGLAGRQVDITTTYAATAGLSADTVPTTLALQIRRTTGNVNVAVGAGATRTITQVGTLLTSVIRYTVDPTDVDIGACYQVAGGYPTRTYDRSLTVQSMAYQVVPTNGKTRNDAMLDTFVKNAIAAAAIAVSGGYSVVVTVKPSGGDYTHPKLALDAINDASQSKKYLIAIYPGTYNQYSNWHTKDYVDLFGMGLREAVIIDASQPNTITPTQIRAVSTMWLDTQTTLRNLTITGTNIRYPIHCETGGLKPNIESRIENCVVTHYGCAGVTANVPGATDYWNIQSQYGVGAGNSAGQKLVFRGSTMSGPGGGSSYHLPNNGVAYTAPTIMDAEGCKFVNTDPGTGQKAAFSIKPICVGAGDSCRLVGCTFVGDVNYSSTEWLDTTDTTSNRAQIHVWGYGNTGFNFVNLVTGAGASYLPAMT